MFEWKHKALCILQENKACKKLQKRDFFSVNSSVNNFVYHKLAALFVHYRKVRVFNVSVSWQCAFVSDMNVSLVLLPPSLLLLLMMMVAMMIATMMLPLWQALMFVLLTEHGVYAKYVIKILLLVIRTILVTMVTMMVMTVWWWWWGSDTGEEKEDTKMMVMMMTTQKKREKKMMTAMISMTTTLMMTICQSNKC